MTTEAKIKERIELQRKLIDYAFRKLKVLSRDIADAKAPINVQISTLMETTRLLETRREELIVWQDALQIAQYKE